MLSPSQRPLPENTQHSQQTNIHAHGGIRIHDLSRRALDRAAAGIIKTLYRKDLIKRVVTLCLRIFQATNQERKILSFRLYIRMFYMRNNGKNLAVHVPEDWND